MARRVAGRGAAYQMLEDAEELAREEGATAQEAAEAPLGVGVGVPGDEALQDLLRRRDRRLVARALRRRLLRVLLGAPLALRRQPEDDERRLDVDVEHGRLLAEPRDERARAGQLDPHLADVARAQLERRLRVEERRRLELERPDLNLAAPQVDPRVAVEVGREVRVEQRLDPAADVHGVALD